ncbi:MAG: ubiquitin-conjugating enzyme E2 [Candidatus Hodarchaeota archaeon]
MPELPFEIWKDRIENELNNIKKLRVLEENSIIKGDTSIEFTININALGIIQNKGELTPQRSHQVFLKINRSFPYPGGIDFSWITNIFHPNIHPVQIAPGVLGTGYICLNVLKKWSRLSDLETTIKALKNLIENPNPDDPLNYAICLEAAELFKKKSMENIKEELKITAEEIEEKEEIDEDVIIIDD